MNLSKHCKITKRDYQSDGQFQRNRSVYDTALVTVSELYQSAYTCFHMFYKILRLSDYQNLNGECFQGFIGKS